MPVHTKAPPPDPIVVFDTNVLASGLIGLPRERSVPGELIRRWFLGRFNLIVSEPILTELEHHAFANPYFLHRITPEEGQRLITLLRDEATVIDLTVSVQGIAPDPDDDHVLAAAISAGADYLVTGDRRLRAVESLEGITIISPREFLDIMEAE